MHCVSICLFLFVLALATATPVQVRGSCTFKQRRHGVSEEIKTIRSHSSKDAAAIPLALLASRTFYITPNELGGKTLPPVNVGVTADTVRAELVTLATILDAGVPPENVHYINNKNGSVTVDFIQTDRIALPRVNVREIHEFDQKTCQITKITGYVHGALACNGPSGNSIVDRICTSVQ